MCTILFLLEINWTTKLEGRFARCHWDLGSGEGANLFYGNLSRQVLCHVSVMIITVHDPLLELFHRDEFTQSVGTEWFYLPLSGTGGSPAFHGHHDNHSLVPAQHLCDLYCWLTLLDPIFYLRIDEIWSSSGDISIGTYILINISLSCDKRVVNS